MTYLVAADLSQASAGERMRGHERGYRDGADRRDQRQGGQGDDEPAHGSGDDGEPAGDHAERGLVDVAEVVAVDLERQRPLVARFVTATPSTPAGSVKEAAP